MLLLLFSLLSFCNTSKPNVLLILLDDLGNADTSFNFKLTNPDKPEPPISTPNLDSLANKGIIFSNHYTHESCCPSRSALLTSIFSHRLGNPFSMLLGGHLQSNIKTIGHEFNKRGYRNHFIGKYGIDFHNRSINLKTFKWSKPDRYSEYGPFARGFNTFYGLLSSGHDHYTKIVRNIVDWHIYNDTHMLDAPNDFDTEPDLSSTHIFTRETINKIKEFNGDKDSNTMEFVNKPFFIHLSYSMPHDPLMIDDYYMDKKYFPHCAKSKNRRRRIYCGMVSAIDEGIGNITKYLKNNNLLENTIIIFSSDNGGFPAVGGYNYPFKGVKATSFQGGIKTPAFIYSPKLFKKTSGHIYNGLIHLVDWAPTLLSLVDSTQNIKFKHNMGNIDGIDLSNTLKLFNDDKYNKNLPKRTYIVPESDTTNKNRTTYIENEWKLILGSVDFDMTFEEPNSKYFLNTNQYKLSLIHYNIIYYWDYLVENILGQKWFVIEWAFTFQIEFLHSSFIKKTRSRKFDKLNIKNKDIPYYIPKLNWNRVRLYNLNIDPYEKNNIALINKNKTIELYNKFIKILERDYKNIKVDLYGFVARFFRENLGGTVWKIIYLLFGVNFILFITCFCYCKNIGCCKRKVKKD